MSCVRQCSSLGQLSRLAMAITLTRVVYFKNSTAARVSRSPIDTNIKIALLAGEVYNALGDPSLAAVFQLSRSEGAEYGTPLLARQLSDSIWLTLDTLSIDEIDAVASATAGYHARGWLELNKAIRREEFSLRGQLDALARWQGVWTQHAATSYLPSALLSLNAAWDRRPRHIGLILPLQTAAGRALQEGFIAAYYQSLAISREVPRISVIDSSEATDAFSVYDEALRLGVDLVVGPLDKALVNQIAELPRLPTLTLALNYADNDDESGVGKPSDLVQFGLAPENEIEQIIALARQRGFKRAAVITPEGDNYTRLRATFQSRWEQSGGSVVARSRFRSRGRFQRGGKKPSCHRCERRPRASTSRDTAAQQYRVHTPSAAAT